MTTIETINAELRAKLTGWHENETIEAMREAIREACRYIDCLNDTECLGQSKDAISALAKLQPFLP